MGPIAQCIDLCLHRWFVFTQGFVKSLLKPEKYRNVICIEEWIKGLHDSFVLRFAGNKVFGKKTF